ncbi:hypothetical protein [Hansschlegelia zhihuaiae]|uniref:Uncharacterized protein n=1 Tax=Hansschlegelia zhihuaiae TaxID=405005 RepID=A0A4V1KJV7_9HYPH|nr:hypothetical protein [Hansschlegelia zhihuaiae]RXF75532.1 hypothetical protein EK403_01365 [Hansschlegelia zhihuaiae]
MSATPIDVQARLEYARAAVAVLRALRIMDTKMRYGQFAEAIGLISDGGKWEPWHQQQVRDILVLVAATEGQPGAQIASPLEFDRIVNKDGTPGAGFHKTSKILSANVGT